MTIDEADELGDEDAGDELEDLLKEGFLAGLFDQMRGQFQNLGSAAVEDCVFDAVRKVLDRLMKTDLPPVDDLKGYLAVAAYNCCRKEAKRQDKELDEDPEDVRRIPVDDAALQDAAAAVVKAEIRTWENANIREVTLICIEAAVLGEPITAEEIAELVGQILDEDISVTSVSQWKARGLRRLRKFIEESDWFERPTTAAEEEGM